MAKLSAKGITSMGNIFNKMMLGSALVLCAAGTASANQLLVYVTSQQIIQAIGATTGTGIAGGASVGATTTSFGGACSAGLTDCGVYAIGASTAALTLTPATTTSSVAGYSSPVPTGNAAWTAVMLSGGYSGYEVAGGAGATAQEEFITANTHVVSATPGVQCTSGAAGCYGTSSLTPLRKLNGVAAMNASTNIGQVAFILTFANTISAGTTVNLSLELFASQIGLNTGIQGGNKNTSGTLILNNLATVALPEPSSIALAFSGMGALGFAAWRRRRQTLAAGQAV